MHLAHLHFCDLAHWHTAGGDSHFWRRDWAHKWRRQPLGRPRPIMRVLFFAFFLCPMPPCTGMGCGNRGAASIQKATTESMRASPLPKKRVALSMAMGTVTVTMFAQKLFPLPSKQNSKSRPQTSGNKQVLCQAAPGYEDCNKQKLSVVPKLSHRQE